MRIGSTTRTLMAAALVVCVAACEPRSQEMGTVAVTADSAAATAAVPLAEPPSQPLVDTAIAPAMVGEEGWGYGQEVEADLDSDGDMERVVLTARVELYRGRPAWDDGQPWQVYVEESDGRRTYLYSRFVQLGTVTMRVGRAEGTLPPSVVLLEQLPDRLAVHEVQYDGPGDVTATLRFQRALDPTGDVAAPVLP